MDNCTFLYHGGGICPYQIKSCKKTCSKYAIVGDASKEIFHDWNDGIEKLVIELRVKHFGTTQKLIGVNPIVKQEQEEFNEDDFLGE